MFDPCCGSGGHVRAVAEVRRAHARATAARRSRISIFGQESNTRRGGWQDEPRDPRHRGEPRPHHADSFHNDVHKDLKADFVLANPPFNVSDWGGQRLREDGAGSTAPPPGQRQFRLGPAHRPPPGPDGVAGFVLGQRLDVVEPVGRGRHPAAGRGRPRGLHDRPAGTLFYTDRNSRLPLVPRAQPKATASSATVGVKTLFVDARKLGRLIDRIRRELVGRGDRFAFASVYHAWRGEPQPGPTPMSRLLQECPRPGDCGARVRADAGPVRRGQDVEDEGEPFQEKMKRLTTTLREQRAEAAKLDADIATNLKELGYGG